VPANTDNHPMIQRTTSTDFHRSKIWTQHATNVTREKRLPRSEHLHGMFGAHSRMSTLPLAVVHLDTACVQDMITIAT
jgi:hypothetical protein